MPAHTHASNWAKDRILFWLNGSQIGTGSLQHTGGAEDAPATLDLLDTGGGQSHSVLNAYQGIYGWERTK